MGDSLLSAFVSEWIWYSHSRRFTVGMFTVSTVLLMEEGIQLEAAILKVIFSE